MKHVAKVVSRNFGNFFSGALLAGIVTILAVPGVEAGLGNENLYLTDSLVIDSGDGTAVYEVILDSVTQRANLEMVGPGPISFDQVDALATMPDGSTLIAIDKNTSEIGFIDVASGSFVASGQYVTYQGSVLPKIVLAAFCLNSRLYVASQDSAHDNRLYLVDPTNGEATLVGNVQIVDGSGNPIGALKFLGADFAFASDGSMYAWTNSTRRLYELTLPGSVPGVVEAVSLGGGNDGQNPNSHFFTGLAFRANGLGDLVGSNTFDEIHVQGRDGSDVEVYTMYRYGAPYDYTYGDMASAMVGEVQLRTRTIGYYKNHSWHTSVTLCNGEILITEDGVVTPEGDSTYNGKEILSNAKNKNISMLVAQLIAAKLNVNNASGVQEYGIAQAEDWLCQQDNVVIREGGVVVDFDWDAQYEAGQKGPATAHKDAMDAFNNAFDVD